MGLFSFLFGGNRKERELLSLQKLVMKDSPNRLVMSERQLNSAATRLAKNDLRIVKDCISLISSTDKPSVFFSRLDLLEKTGKHLTLLEPHVSFSVSPSAAYREVIRKKEECIYSFLERYCNAVRIKANGMKTEKGKLNKYQKSYTDLEPYFNKISISNMAYIKKMLKQE